MLFYPSLSHLVSDLILTQGLCMVLAAVCEKGSTILEPHLDNVLNVLFTQVKIVCCFLYQCSQNTLKVFLTFISLETL